LKSKNRQKHMPVSLKSKNRQIHPGSLCDWNLKIDKNITSVIEI
jgi:hypothetical protein